VPAVIAPVSEVRGERKNVVPVVKPMPTVIIESVNQSSSPQARVREVIMEHRERQQQRQKEGVSGDATVASLPKIFRPVAPANPTIDVGKIKRMLGQNEQERSPFK